MKRHFGFAAALAALTVPAASCSAVSQPNPTKEFAPNAALEFTGYVVDQANVLSPQQRDRLTERLGRFQRTSRHQLAVVTVKTLGGRGVAEFTRDLANRWGVGRKGVNDGIVILVAPTDRKARISVGRGLEARLPDGFCQQVMDRDMVPQFAAGKFDAGISAGVEAILGRLALSGGKGG